ncbi:MAG: YcnI family protein [Cryobacterium sp.]|nr:YcnI family protein [Cryobacterium sp.]
MNRTSTAVVALGAALLLALAAPAAASAHVTVSPNTAPAGSYALVNIKVPNESATAVTNKIEVSLPTDTPFTNVSYVPVAGWATELVRETLPSPVKIGDNTITEAVVRVVWTATPGHEISAGQLQVFPLSLGPVPDTGTIVMPTEQTYSDGTVVSWNETADNAQHPAPVLYVNDAPASDNHGAATAPTADHDATDAHEGAAGGAGESGAVAASDGLARGLGVGGLVIGAIGIVLATAAMRRKAAK